MHAATRDRRPRSICAPSRSVRRAAARSPPVRETRGRARPATFLNLVLISRHLPRPRSRAPQLQLLTTRTRISVELLGGAGRCTGMDGSSAPLAELRAAVAPDPHPSHRAAHTAATRLIARTAGADTDRFVLGWDRFPEAATAIVGQPGWTMTVAVMANLLSVADFGEPRTSRPSTSWCSATDTSRSPRSRHRRRRVRTSPSNAAGHPVRLAARADHRIVDGLVASGDRTRMQARSPVAASAAPTGWS